jgi:hypothetical protein
MVISGCGSDRVADANVDVRRRVGCIRARVSRRRTGPWRRAWRLLLASCALRLMYAPISRWDLQRGEIPNAHGRDPIDPVGISQWVKPNRQTSSGGQTQGHTDAPTFPCCEASTSPPGVSCPTSHDPAQIVDANGWSWGVVGSCAIAAPQRSYVNCIASSEQIHPAGGLMLRSDGAVLSGVRYVYSPDKQSS